MPDGTRSQDSAAPIQREARLCPYCRAMFAPKRLRQEFCSDTHRIAYHRDVGCDLSVRCNGCGVTESGDNADTERMARKWHAQP
jgi:hypothetical protein